MISIKLFFFTLLCSFLFAYGHTSASEEVYMFCYFKGNGEDGVHFAYSVDGYHWQALKGDSSFLKPTVFKGELMRDPCIIRGADGFFHMVWTDGWNCPTIGYASSKDLIHWSDQKSLAVMDQQTTTKNCWAPEITYDSSGQLYMIYWASIVPEVGKKSYNRIYAVTTRDFKTYTTAKLLYDPGFNVIDATIVKDSGRYIMFLKNETASPPEKNIRIAFASSLNGPYSRPGEPITGAYWAEGPTTLKMGNEWLVYFDKYMEHKFGAIRSGNLENWTDISDSIELPVGIRHGTIFKITAAEFAKLHDIR